MERKTITTQKAISTLTRFAKDPTDPFLREALNLAIAALEVYRAKPELFKIVPNFKMSGDCIILADPVTGKEISRIINIGKSKGGDMVDK